MKKLLLTLGLVCAFTCNLAQAASISVKGQELNYKMPEGYCAFNPQTEKESSYIQFFDKALGRSVDLKALVAPCEEISKARAGKYEGLSNFILIGLVGVDGHFMKFRLGNKAYMGFAKLLKPQDIERTVKRANERLKPFNAKVQSLMISDPYIENNQVNFEGNINLCYKDISAGFDFRLASALADDWPIAVGLLYRNDRDAKKPLLAYLNIMHDLKNN